MGEPLTVLRRWPYIMLRTRSGAQWCPVYAYEHRRFWRGLTRYIWEYVRRG